ncbi:hypothetical protein SAMN02745181_1081 [Rubritalea squalenifaciens DSM 18772]|uniref:DUF4175 family protein n=1 Tax=Rubritalea squalenifaciens DSM 18772 TaxID=1123071 RepID=A0A1M6ENW6_9BACT|nr:hypothetical protein [Rubritalea squalenifaciens]SHI87162.1 hypothetical protein SAMN02745181_1081 [Rubritalea squalenifaciens DSM 18772]
MFSRNLNRIKRNHALGHILLTVLLVAGVLATVAIIYGLADMLWALESSTRKILNLILISIAAFTVIFLVARAIFKPASSIADFADEKLAGSDHKIRAAHDLLDQGSPNDLHAYLKQKSLDEAAAELKKLQLSKQLPLKWITGSIASILVIFGIITLLQKSFPEAYLVVSQRILEPSSDTPPFTRLRFELTQENQTTFYGGENLVKASITGDEIKEQVTCLVRNRETGEIETTSTFQQDESTYSRKFTNIVSGFDVAFACGKARSNWLPVEVLLQPKFTSAQITVTPPSYTKQQEVSFPLEGNEIKVIEGSTVTLEITSNRPLSGGTLTLTPLTKDETQAPEIILGTSDNSSTATFKWVARRSSDLSCIIHDVRSTPSSSSLDLTISTSADLPPIPELESPNRMVLATPKAKIPLRGRVEDDHGIDSVMLVRTLVGFRDRAKNLAESVEKKEYDYSQPIDLEALGVQPEQTLEFYLEARDYNPSMLGIGSSDVARVYIISEETYAARIRESATIREFLPRYRELDRAIDDARKALERLQEANQKDDEEAFKKALKEAIAAHLKSQDLAHKLANDFYAYEMEGRLGDVARETHDKLMENEQDLHDMDYKDGKGDNQEMIEKMLERLGGVEEKADDLVQDAEKVKKIGEVMKLAGDFMRIYYNQRSLATRKTNIAKEINKGIMRNKMLLPKLGQSQLKNQDALVKFAKELRVAAEQLPDEAVDLKDGSLEFLEKLEGLQVAEAMEAAAKAAKIGQSVEASSKAHLAAKLLQQLIDMKDNEFAALLRGEMPKNDFNMKPDAKKTLEQMLEAMLNRARRAGNQGQGGAGEGAGGGGMGMGGGGFGMGQDGQPGSMGRNLSMFGPERLNFSDSPHGNSQGGKAGQGGGSGKGTPPSVSGSNTIKPTDQQDSNSSRLKREKVPEKYRDAVKKFYTTP